MRNKNCLNIVRELLSLLVLFAIAPNRFSGNKQRLLTNKDFKAWVRTYKEQENILWLA
jgi:hypothetical protein